jgi:glyoxylase-like metal-dependent hydrolase (beta-lactamase superfamily II)
MGTPAFLKDDAALIRGRHIVADCELTMCTDGSFRLDGGAMFGVVPKTLWQGRMPADAENRVLLGTNCAVVRTGNAVVLIETGIGNKQSEKMRAIHQNQELLPASLAAAGIEAGAVTHVVNTHLHFDHCGWNTTLHSGGSVTPTFPNARYFAAAGEVAAGRLQRDRDRVSYLGPNYDPLIASGQLTLIDLGGVGGFSPDDARLRPSEETDLPPVPIQTTAEITPGVWVEVLPGHTPDVLGVHIGSPNHGGPEAHACHASDLIPTSRHLEPTWVMGFDLDPLRCIEERKRFLRRAIAEDWLVLFPHDHQVPAARLEWNEKAKAVVRERESI